MSVVIKSKNRNPSDYTNKQIIEVFRNCEKPDVDLIVSNGKIVSAHRVILAMYSKYMRKTLSHTDAEHRFIVSLIAFPLIAIQTVVDFLYYGEVRVLNSIKGQVIKALDFLEVDYVLPSSIPRIPSTANIVPINPSNISSIKRGGVNKNIPPQMNAKIVGTKPMQVQNKPNLQQQVKPNGVTANQSGRSANLVTDKNSTLVTKEKPKTDVQPKQTFAAPPDKSSPLSTENSQSTVQSIQAEAMTTPKNAESTISSENAPENMLISSDLSNEADAVAACKPPVAEVEKVEENLAARLLNYDVDKATEQIQSQLDELMKEMECDLEDAENAFDDIEL